MPPLTLDSTAGLTLLAAVGALAGAINTVAGAGSLLTLPALILLGMPADLANGTNRVGVLVQTAAATARFGRAGLLEAGQAARLLVPSAVGAALGAQLSLGLDEARMRQVIGVALLLLLAPSLARPERWLAEEPRPTRLPGALRAGIFFGIGLYGGFLQAGVGLFLVAALVLVEGLDLRRANAVKTLLVGAFTLPAAAVFAWGGRIAWGPGLALALGSALGGWLGARLALGWGPRVLRGVLLGVIVLSASRLLGLW